MTQDEFQQLHGFDDEDMKRIKALCKIFNGKITEVKEQKHG